jgi:uncharacterized protein YrrD
MLRSADALQACQIKSSDGVLDKINDLYFDDDYWVVRYLVVDTSNWLIRRKALISPIALEIPDWLNNTIQTNLSQEQINNCPGIGVHRPVSRQQEIKYCAYYGYPIYWRGNGLWGEGLYPNGKLSANSERDTQPNANAVKAFAEAHKEDPHLRSWCHVKGFSLCAADGEIGQIHDFLLDEQTFAIRYVIVQTNDWWLGHQVLIAPQWFMNVQWSDSKVVIKHTREEVKSAPSYHSGDSFDRNREEDMHHHYGVSGYWHNEPSSSPQHSRPDNW